MRYGIYGGTFDPPHEGHKRLAVFAASALRLDCVLWVPAQDPPLKDKPRTAFAHRLAMVEIVVAGLAGHRASGVEARLPAPSYSLNMIRALKDEFGSGHAWFLLIGADNWSVFPKWHKHNEVLREATLAVYPRAGHALALPPHVLRLDAPLVPAESHLIRTALAQGSDPGAAGVLSEIRDYIREHHLYEAAA